MERNNEAAVETVPPQQTAALAEMPPAVGATHIPQSTPTYNWMVVTDSFKSACDELSLGELMHDDLFGLFEAMSAIEMMDPKMDAGMRCNAINKSVNSQGGRQQPLTFWTAKESGHLPMDPKCTSSKDLIGLSSDKKNCSNC